MKEPAVLEGKADKDPPGETGGYGQGDRQGIADIAGAVPEADFYFHQLITGRAAVVHLHELSQIVGVTGLEHVACSATRAFVLKEAP